MSIIFGSLCGLASAAGLYQCTTPSWPASLTEEDNASDLEAHSSTKADQESKIATLFGKALRAIGSAAGATIAGLFTHDAFADSHAERPYPLLLIISFATLLPGVCVETQRIRRASELLTHAQPRYGTA